jgi:hypothetical protein
MLTLIERRVTGGVDTHDDVHVAAVLDSATGRQLGTQPFPTTPAGYSGLLSWMQDLGGVDCIGVESTGSWGAGLARHLTGVGIDVIEVDRPDRKARRHDGKSDPTDAVAAARAALSGRATAHDGAVEAIRTLEIVYHAAMLDRTRAINQFKALIVTAPDGLRHRLRDGLSLTEQLAKARRFTDNLGALHEHAARPARRVKHLALERLDDLHDQPHNRLRRKELATEATFRHGEARQEVLVNQPERIPAQRSWQRSEQSQQALQKRRFQLRVAPWQHILQARVVHLDGRHCLIDLAPDTAGDALRQLHQARQQRLFGHVQHTLGPIVIRRHRVPSRRLRLQLWRDLHEPMLRKGQEDQPQNRPPIIRRRQRRIRPQLIRRLPQLPFKITQVRLHAAMMPAASRRELLDLACAQASQLAGSTRMP